MAQIPDGRDNGETEDRAHGKTAGVLEFLPACTERNEEVMAAMGVL